MYQPEPVSIVVNKVFECGFVVSFPIYIRYGNLIFKPTLAEKKIEP